VADIKDAIQQLGVADSILDDSNIIATLTHEGNFVRPEEVQSDAEHGESVFDDPEDYFAEAIYAQEHDAQKLGDAGLAQKIEREQGEQPETREQPAERLRSERQESEQTEQQTQEQSQPLTREVIQESMAGLDNFIQENQLNAGAAAAFPHELCSALGTTPDAAGINPQGVIDFSAKSVVAGLREIELSGGDFSRIQPMPDSLAMEVGFDACKMLGYDPRGDGVNPNGVAQTARFATLNILKTIHETGFTDPEKINSREAVEYFGNELYKNLGHKGAMPPAVARQFGDAWTNRVLSIIGQLRQTQAQRTESQPRSRRVSGPRIPAGLRDAVRGSKAPRFISNQDIFSGPGFQDALRQQL
jgi:hypothetical protein